MFESSKWTTVQYAYCKGFVDTCEFFKGMGDFEHPLYAKAKEAVFSYEANQKKLRALGYVFFEGADLNLPSIFDDSAR